MQKTSISYLTHTWNPIAMRCTPVSEGCANCWHLKFANRHAHNPKFSKEMRKAYSGGEPYLREDELIRPFKLKKPSRIGVQFMGDLFYEHVYFEWIDQVLEVVMRNPRHIFIFLTKRPLIMQFYFNNIINNTMGTWDRFRKSVSFYDACHRSVIKLRKGKVIENLWLGVSVENQEQANKRIPILLEIPAAVRFVSVEPMLSKIYISDYFADS